MKQLLKYLKDYKKECALGPLFKLLEAMLELLVPLVMAAIIDRGIQQQDRGYVMQMCLVLMGLAAVGLVSSVTAQYFAARAAVGFSASLKHALLQHMQSLSYAEIDRLGTSAMITRMTSDVNQLQSGVNMGLRLLLRSPFVVLGAVIMAFVVDGRAALVFVGVVPVLSLVVYLVMHKTIPMYRRVQSKLDDVTRMTRENLAGARVIRAFCREEEETADFQQENESLARIQQKVGRISALMNPGTYVLINLAVVVLLWVGALRVNSGILTQGQVVALYNYMSQILVELIKFANLLITLTRAVACGNRVQAVLETRSSQRAGNRLSEKDAARGEVRFSHVSLTYGEAGAPSLSDVDFTAKPGQVIGIIGGTGSGKSSLVNLIPRFYDATEGTVSVDGLDVREYAPSALRARIGVVPQQAVLFRGSIRENLRWGDPEADDAALYRALDLAQAREIVAGKEDGLDTLLEQGGRNLSGGQRQRLTIARALVRRPEILILDDSGSALDYATDAKLRMAIASLTPRPTTFIVSQRAASIRYADWILVLEEGAVVGQGTHDMLMRSCPVYQEIYHSQFREEAQADA